MRVTPVDARAIAQEAYVFGLPPVHIGIQADVLSHASKQAPRGQFVHHRRTPDASTNELLGFNVDTLYSTGIVDVSREPFVLSVPVMRERYWIVQLLDAWNEVSAAPSTRTFGGAGGNFAIVGPRWQGTLPEDLIEIRAATSLLIVAPRIYTSGPADYPAVHALQDQLRLTPLSKWGTAYSPPLAVPIVRTNGFEVCDPAPVSKRIFDLSPQDYFARLCQLLVDNPPHSTDAPVLARMAKLGITPGASFRIDAFAPEVRDAIYEGVRAAQKEIVAARQELGKQRNGWHVARDVGRYGDRYAYRAAWTFHASGGSLVEDVFYATTLIDCMGKKLSGSEKYVLWFPGGQHPPVHAFWSLTMYAPDLRLVANSIQRYSLGSRDRMRLDSDGSLRIYIQHTSPGIDLQMNWLPAPAGEFLLAMRLYAPRAAVTDGSWNPPPVMRVDP